MDIKELATLTAAEMDDIYLRNVPAIVLEQYATRLIATLEQQVAALKVERDKQLAARLALCTQLAAAQAREAKLRDAAKAVLEVGMGSDFEALNAAFAIPTDDSALMERLKEERERVALRLIKCGHPKPVIDAIRSMT